MNPDLIKKVIRWLLAGVTVLYVISGFGITEFRVVQGWTFGLLTKDLSFKIHEDLWILFVVLFVLHVSSSLIFKSKK